MDQLIKNTKEKMQSALGFLHNEYSKLQTGRASVTLVDTLMVESYGAKSPLKALANLSVPESNQIIIQPWNREDLANVEKAIRESDLGLNPQNDGMVIRLILPPMTEERRKEIVKTVHKHAEEARISIRNARHDTLKTVKTMQKEGELSEDELRLAEKKLQELVDHFNKETDELAKKKDQELMHI